jgi:hypothetical protein
MCPWLAARYAQIEEEMKIIRAPDEALFEEYADLLKPEGEEVEEGGDEDDEDLFEKYADLLESGEEK